MKLADNAIAQRPLNVHLPDTAGFETFHPGPNNEPLAAVVALTRASSGSHFLWGKPGSGKTHLLQAACREAGTSGAAAYLPLRDLADEPPAALEGLADGRLLCLDDVEAVAGSRAWEAALVAQIERLRHTGGRLLCSGFAAPGGLGLKLADLVSRLSAGSVHHLRPLRDPDRLAALQLRAARRGLKLPTAVANYLLARAPRDMPALMSLLEQLDQASMAAKRRLTVPFVREVLALGSDSPRRTL